jgi:hypothetical protein
VVAEISRISGVLGLRNKSAARVRTAQLSGHFARDPIGPLIA